MNSNVAHLHTIISTLKELPIIKACELEAADMDKSIDAALILIAQHSIGTLQSCAVTGCSEQIWTTPGDASIISSTSAYHDVTQYQIMPGTSTYLCYDHIGSKHCVECNGFSKLCSYLGCPQKACDCGESMCTYCRNRFCKQHRHNKCSHCEIPLCEVCIIKPFWTTNQSFCARHFGKSSCKYACGEWKKRYGFIPAQQPWIKQCAFCDTVGCQGCQRLLYENYWECGQHDGHLDKTI